MTVSITIEGLPRLKKFLKNKSKAIESGENRGLAKATFYIQNEVKESIAGRRAEGPFTIIPRKVTRGGRIRGPIVQDTVDIGTFLASVDVNTRKGIIFTKSKYAKGLEFGTTRTKPRRHFGNTAARERRSVRRIIEKEIKKSI